MTSAPSWLVTRLIDASLLPDQMIRSGIRRILASRLGEETARAHADPAESRRRFVTERSRGPIAVDAVEASALDDVPAEFYRLVLGRHMKYSSAWWDEHTASLDDAEARMLAISAERAGLADGQRVLDLGCGWGSFALWMARRFPRSEIVGVSNSHAEKRWIDGVIGREGLSNLRIITADMNTFDAPGTFDRVVSVEMFEHMRNWRALLANVARWLRDDGCLFVHIFTHRRYAYPYEARDRVRLDGPLFFRRRHHAERRSSLRVSRSVRGSRALAHERDALPEDRRRLAREHGPPSGGDRTRAWPVATASGTCGVRGRAGACSSWPAPRCGAIAAATNGSCRTIGSRNLPRARPAREPFSARRVIGGRGLHA